MASAEDDEAQQDVEEAYHGFVVVLVSPLSESRNRYAAAALTGAEQMSNCVCRL